MPVLILSSTNKEMETEIAQQIAQKLKFTTINDQFLDEIANKYTIEPKKLALTLNSTPSIFKRIPAKLWNYYLSCIELEVLERLLEDNCVCWGLAAHLYVVVVSHVFKVRLIGGHEADEQSGQSKLSLDRENWSMAAYNKKEMNPELYDMVINLDQIKPDEVINTVSTTLGYPRFKAMTYSKNKLTDQVLAARVKNALLESLTDIHVQAQNGTVVVTTSSAKREKSKKIDAIKKLAGKVEGIGYLEVHWNKDLITEAVLSSR